MTRRRGAGEKLSERANLLDLLRDSINASNASVPTGPYRVGGGQQSVVESAGLRRRMSPTKKIAIAALTSVVAIGVVERGPVVNALTTIPRFVTSKCTDITYCREKFAPTVWPGPIASSAEFPNLLRKKQDDPQMVGNVAEFTIAALQYRVVTKNKHKIPEFDVMVNMAINPVNYNQMMPRKNGQPVVPINSYTPQQYFADLANNGQKMPQYKAWCQQDVGAIARKAKDFAPALLASAQNSAAGKKPSVTPQMLAGGENYYSLSTPAADNPTVPNVYVSYLTPVVNPTTHKAIIDPATKRGRTETHNIACSPVAASAR